MMKINLNPIEYKIFLLSYYSKLSFIMNKYIKILGIYVGIEILHYSYLLYLINQSDKKLIKNDTDNNIVVPKSTIKKNFHSILNENYKSDNYKSEKYLINFESVYNKILSYNFAYLKKNNFTLITPYPLALRLFYSCSFIFDLLYYQVRGYIITITSDSIILEKSQSNPNSHLILIHSGMLGNIFYYKDLVTNLEKDYSIKICVFRSTLSTLFWNNSDIDSHINLLNNKICYNQNIILISHSFGAFVIEYMLKKYPQINKLVSKEILVQPGNVMSMGLIFLSSSSYSFYNYYKFINKYSTYKKHNFVFTWMLKSLAGKSTITSIKSIDGIRLQPRKFKGYLIVSDNDPLINSNSSHPGFKEIQYIFSNYKIISDKDYHGNSLDKIKLILDCIQD